MTSEGHELQAGLEHAGWKLVGYGYDDGCTDVVELIQRHKPDAIALADPRDWHRRSPGTFDSRAHFRNYEALGSWPGFKILVFKDAATAKDFQAAFIAETRPQALLTYYHDDSVRTAAPWLPADLPLIRTYHSVDADTLSSIDLRTFSRRRGVVSGALGHCYPLRLRVFHGASRFGLERIRHPGYGNRGTHTPTYLRQLANYKVSVATASQFNFALRKVVESVACGCIPVTNLGSNDKLPEIDGALWRVPSDISDHDLQNVINAAERSWNLEERMEWARKAVDFYDYRAAGVRLSETIMAAAEARRAA